MKTFSGENFSVIYYQMLKYGYRQDEPYIKSRVGEVKDLGPSYFEIKEDNFRLPLLKKRGLNPFFALTEFSWLITGSNKLAPLQSLIKNYNKYSDDGETLNGAYGYRLKSTFGIDQIERAIKGLRKNHNTRRIVLTMWSAKDLLANSNDLPCNISIMLKVRNGKLDMTIINRSNDLFLGVPYNVLAFYLLQVYLSNRIGVKIGIQRHFTDSLHVYKRDIEKIKEVIDSNDEDSLIAISNKISSFNMNSYVNIDHNKIINQDYKNISNKEIANFFMSYSEYRYSKNLEKAIKLLSMNSLGYSGYLWYREKKDFALYDCDFEKLMRRH